MNIRRTVFAAITIAMGSTLAMGQDHPPPPKIDIAALLNVDAAKAQQVQAILDGGRSQMKALRDQGRPTDDASREKMHQAMESIHKDTDTKLAAILTADQLAKLKASMPRPPRRDHAPRNPQ